MFEATKLLVRLGLILWFILDKEQTGSVRRASFIDLTAELKPAAKNQQRVAFVTDFAALSKRIEPA